MTNLDLAALSNPLRSSCFATEASREGRRMTAQKTARNRANQEARTAKGRTGIAKDTAKSRIFEIDLDELGRFLRRMHRYEPILSVARDLDVPEATVRNWLEKRCAPSGHHVLLILDRYGPAALAAMWPGVAPQWLDGSVIDAEAAALEAQRAEIEARLQALRATR